MSESLIGMRRNQRLDRDLDDEAVRYQPRAPVPSKLEPLQGDHRHPATIIKGAIRRDTEPLFSLTVQTGPLPFHS